VAEKKIVCKKIQEKKMIETQKENFLGPLSRISKRKIHI
jgi:hypothetical protein